MLARLPVARSLPRVFVARYSLGPSDGSVAQSKPFNQKEKAHENEYAHRRELEELAKLRKEIEKKKKELDALEEQRESIENNKQ